VSEIVGRTPYPFGQLKLLKNLTTVDDLQHLCPEDFSLSNYVHHPSVKAKMVA